MNLSVIIPTLNEEKFIETCLQSIRNQTIPAEIIVVDGGSTDQTVEIAKRYADKVLVAPGIRIGNSRQMGLEAAKNPIVISTDADIIAPPDWLWKLTRHFSDPNVVAVGGPTKPSNPTPLTNLYTYCTSTAARIGFFIGSNTAFRKDALIRAGGYKLDKKGEDWEASIRMKQQGKTICDSEAYIYTDVPSNRQIELSLILVSTGITLMGISPKNMKMIGYGTGFLGTELITTLQFSGPLHHSQLALIGLALINTTNIVGPKTKDPLNGVLSGVLTQHIVTEDINTPPWGIINTAFLVGALLLT